MGKRRHVNDDVVDVVKSRVNDFNRKRRYSGNANIHFLGGTVAKLPGKLTDVRWNWMGDVITLVVAKVGLNFCDAWLLEYFFKYLGFQ